MFMKLAGPNLGNILDNFPVAKVGKYCSSTVINCIQCRPTGVQLEGRDHMCREAPTPVGALQAYTIQTSHTIHFNHFSFDLKILFYAGQQFPKCRINISIWPCMISQSFVMKEASYFINYSNKPYNAHWLAFATFKIFFFFISHF